MELTYSQIMAFKRCPAKYNYAYNLLLSPKIKPVALELGSYVHELLDALYRGGSTGLRNVELITHILEHSEKYYQEKTKGMFEEECVTFQTYKEEAEEIVLRYLDYHQGDLDKYKVVGVEEQFRVPILTPDGEPTGDYLNGKFDLVLADEYDNIFLGEHKTTVLSVKNRLADLELDEQCSYYSWALQQMMKEDGLFLPVSGVIYNVIRKKMPTIPRLLVKGGLSRAKDIDTTYETYLEAIHSNGLNVADYMDMLNMLKLKGNTFYGREIVKRTPQELFNTGVDIYHSYKLISQTTSYHRNRCSNCSRDCSFKDLCIAEIKGYDTDGILENFEIRESLNPELDIQETVED